MTYKLQFSGDLDITEVKMYANSVSKMQTADQVQNLELCRLRSKQLKKQKAFSMYPVYLNAWSVNRKIVDKLFATCPG